MTTQVVNYSDKLPLIKEVAQNRGGKCISVIYVNNRSPLLFECQEGHRWETCWKNIDKGAWCPECAKIKSQGANNSRFDSIENMRQIAIARGGNCVSSEYLGAHVKLMWKCSLGHEWEAKPNSIKNGTWCPKCSDGIGERVCRLIFETVFGKKFPKMRPDWLQNPVSGKNLELDGYCEELGIAFEYNGIQHYQDSVVYTRSQYDAYKWQQCQMYGVKLFLIKEIPYMSKYQQILDELVVQARNYHLNVNCAIEIDINDAYINIDSVSHLARIKEIATKNGGRCSSNVYVDDTYKLVFQCGICDYTWMASPNAIKNGTWCPNCAHKIKSIDDAILLAANKNGKCLSAVYTNSADKMQWECKLGHQWSASYNQIQSGQWCPECFELNRGQKKKLGIEVYQEAANKKNGKCLSSVINSCYDKLEWQCAEGHIWLARADLIKNTKQWCPECARRKKK
jgi:hypothetical protein